MSELFVIHTVGDKETTWELLKKGHLVKGQGFDKVATCDLLVPVTRTYDKWGDWTDATWDIDHAKRRLPWWKRAWRWLVGNPKLPVAKVVSGGR